MISSGLDSSGNSPCGLHSRSQCSDTEPRIPTHPTDTNEDRVIKVEIVRKDDVGRGIPKVKNMTLSSNDRSPAAVKKALKLFDLNEDDAANFALIQILPDDKELRIPDSANVYYAMQSSSDEFHFALMEGEAQYPHQRNPPSSLNGSPATRKKSHRKTLSASGSISTSPMKSLYKLTLGGISLASGSYSPARENEKFENSFEFHALRHQLSPRRDAIIDDLRATSSDSADDESEDAGWRQRMKRIVHGKIHKRTGSDTSRASAESMFEIPPIRRLHARLPARDESTLPRHRVESASTAYTWTRRRAVVRKHHSQPRATRPDDSRSTFYVTSSDERPQSTASMEPINESRDENRAKPLYTRSASDPCVLDLLHGSDSVFEAPSIVVHCASPRKTTFRGEWTSGSSRDGSDCDVISNGKERQSSSDGESTYL
uniref:Ras-associating domain-containing protein n=1 Tax=Ciona savignyi TaxID=51511 RepID=H2YKC8_CIOSA